MNTSLVETIKAAQQQLDPQFKAMRAAIGALNQANRLAGEEKADALAMQKAQAKLEQAAALLAESDLADPTIQQAIATFGDETTRALEALAFEFAGDLKAVFEERGETVTGRPPQLVINELVLNIDIATRKAQWLYGKEALTKPIPLSLNTIVRAYDQQKRAILERKLDPEFTQELFTAWQEKMAERQRAGDGRVNIIELYSKVVLNRQQQRFWNSPSRATFRDYERPHFVRDLVLMQADPTVTVDGKTHRIRLAGATKSQAESAMRSVWLPNSPLDGEYYASLTVTDS